MAGCTNGDRVDEVRDGHVQQVEYGAVLVSRVRSEMMRDRVVFMVRKKVSEKVSEKIPTLHFLLGFFT